MNLLADHNLPFAVALVTMLLLALVQVVGLAGFGFEADADVDADVDSSPLDGLLSLLGIGRLPFTIWLALWLLLFAGAGVAIQSLASGLGGSPLDRWLASGLAVLAALPATGALSRPLAAILPGDETSAVSLDSLLGRRGRVLNGRAAAGFPARARVRDWHGHPHHVMVEPHDPKAEIREGEEVLLVRRENNIFY